MPTLTIRNLPEDVHDALRRRAADHRRSMEAEAREVLTRAVGRPTEGQRREAIQQLHRMADAVAARHPAPEGWSFTDALVAEKRLEAAWEDGRVSDAERLSWTERLGRYDVTPDAVEAFVLSRTRGA